MQREEKISFREQSSSPYKTLGLESSAHEEVNEMTRFKKTYCSIRNWLLLKTKRISIFHKIVIFFMGRPTTKETILRKQHLLCKSAKIKPEDVKNFWDGLEELRPSHKDSSKTDTHDPPSQ